MFRGFTIKRKILLILSTVTLFIVSLFYGCQKTEYDNPHDSSVSTELWAPRSLKVEQTSLKTAKLTWTQPDPRIDSFCIESRRGNNEWKIIGYANKTALSYIDSTFIPDHKTPIDYRISALAWKNKGSSEIINIVPVFGKPEAPKVEKDLGVRLKLSWYDIYNNEDGYKIEKRINGGNWVLCADTIRANSTYYYDNNPELNAQITYRFSVRAAGVYSDTTNAKTISTVIGQPSWITIASLSQTSCRIDWKEGDPWTMGYNIDRQIGNNPWQDGWLKLDKTKTSFTDSNFPFDQDVRYRLSAVVNNYASDKVDLVYGIPQLDTVNISNIQYLSATIKARVKSESGFPVIEWGFVYSTNPNPTIADLKVSTTLPINLLLNYNLTGLDNSKTYYIRPYALNRRGESYGEQRILTLKKSTTPLLDNVIITRAMFDYIRLTSNIIDDRSLPIIESGFVCSTNPAPTINDSKGKVTPQRLPNGTYTLSGEIYNLKSSTDYYVRSYATNSLGTSYGPENKTQTLTYTLPTIDSLNIDYLSASYMRLYGFLKYVDGDLTTNKRGFVYSSHENPTELDSIWVDPPENYNRTRGFYTFITGLKPNHTYHIRAFCQNKAGMVYSPDKAVTTLGMIPVQLDIPRMGSCNYTDAGFQSQILEDGGNTIIEAGFVYSTSPAPTVNDNKLPSKFVSPYFTMSNRATNLQEGTKYYLRAYVQTNTGIIYSPDVSFTTRSYTLPIINNISVSTLGYTTTSLISWIESVGYDPSGETGFIFGEHPGLTMNDSILHTDNGHVTADIKVTLKNLQQGHTYYVRSYAKNVRGTVLSQELSFTTLIVTTPKVSTTSLSQIYNTSAQCNSYVYNDGGDPIIESGFVYSTSPLPTINDNKVLCTINSYSSIYFDLKSLNEGTTYYIRSFARNSIGIGYGDVTSFKTLVYTLPAVGDVKLGAIYPNVAFVSSTAVSNGGDYWTENGFVYGDNINPTISDNRVITNTASSYYDFSTKLTNLIPSHTYHVRAYQKNAKGITYSSDQILQTKDLTAPIMGVLKVYAMKNSTFEMYGSVLSDGGQTIIESGFVYSVRTGPTLNDNKIIANITQFSDNTYYTNQTITNLVPGQKYYIRAYAVNASGITYSNEVESTTLP